MKHLENSKAKIPKNPTVYDLHLQNLIDQGCPTMIKEQSLLIQKKNFVKNYIYYLLGKFTKFRIKYK